MTASDQQRLIVDAYARYRITDQLKFYQNVRYEDRVREVVGPLIESEIRRVLGSATLQEVVKDKREALMKQIATSGEQGRPGVRHSKWSTCASSAPICRRRTSSKSTTGCAPTACARQRSCGRKAKRQSNRIRANADKDVTIIKADATQKSDRDPRRRRGGTQPDFRRCLRPGSRLLPLLPVDAGLQSGDQAGGYAHAAVARQRVFPLLPRS